MNIEQVKHNAIAGFFIIAILGTLLHFTYQWSGNSIAFSWFSAINESVWEHLKIAVMPVFIWTMIEILFLKRSYTNWATSLLFEVLVLMVFIPVVFYTYTSFTKHSILWVDITTFYLAILLGQWLAYQIRILEPIGLYMDLMAAILVIIILTLFVIFTFYPPRLEIFRDSIDHTYGVYKVT